MAKRKGSAPNTNRRITLSAGMWRVIDRYVALKTQAYAEMKAKTKHSVSDFLEEASDLLLRSIVEEVGLIPDENATKSEVDRFVKALIDDTKRLAVSEFMQSKH